MGNAALVGCAYFSLYELNDYLFSNFAVSGYASWIFLPAAVRILSIMLAGTAGAWGLFASAMVINNPVIGVNVVDSIALSSFSALGPLAAVAFCFCKLSVARDLKGLKWWHLLVIAVVAAVFNVSSTQSYLWSVGKVEGWVSEWSAMFVGDLLGTLLVLFFASFLAKLAAKIRSINTSVVA